MSKDYKTVNYSGVYKMPVKDADGVEWFTHIEYQARIEIETDGFGHDRESHIASVEEVEVSLESPSYVGEFQWVTPNNDLFNCIYSDIENKFSRGLIE